MGMLESVILVLHLLVAIAICGFVLLQHGKGADMGAAFGSGSSGSLFGATGSANFLSRTTAVCAAVFFVCTLGLAYLSNDRSHPSSGSVLDRPSSVLPAASGIAPAPGASAAVAASAASAAPASAPSALPSK